MLRAGGVTSERAANSRRAVEDYSAVNARADSATVLYE